MAATPHVLIVEDEGSIRLPLHRFLEKEGYRVTSVANAAEARSALPNDDFSLAILDIMMPGEDGLSLARWIRAQGALPLLFLSARSEDIDRIVGLEMGGDDYLTKPFNPRELLARIRAILRRVEHAGPCVDAKDKALTFGRFRLDREEQSLSKDGAPINLTAGEYRLLEALATRAGRILDRDQLLGLVHGRSAECFDRSIDNIVFRLRRKMGPDGAALIRTARSLGYSFIGKVETG